MDENRSIAKSNEVSEEDVIHLLNHKKQNGREILCVTNAAANAIACHLSGQTKRVKTNNANKLTTDDKENHLNKSTKQSVLSIGSGDAYFHGEERVRVPSRLLREIKSPLDRSGSGNTSSSSKDTSTGTLFASQSNSDQSFYKTTNSSTKIVKQASKYAHPTQKEKKKHQNPVVINYLPETSSSNFKESSLATRSPKLFKSKIKDDEHVPTHDTNKEKNEECKSLQSQENRILPKFTYKEQTKFLHQGLPSDDLSHMHLPDTGEVKSLSFNVTAKEKATRNMLTKKQEHGAAVRKVVQPKIVEEIQEQDVLKPTVFKENKTGSETSDKHQQPSKETEQIASGFEEKMNNVMNTLTSIENHCEQYRIWQEKHEQVLKVDIRQRDEKRLQHLEEMQKHLVEYQLRNSQPITASMVHPSNVNGMAQDASKIDSRQLPTSKAVASADITSNLHNDSILSTTNYTKAVEHKTQPSFKTTVYGSVSSDEKPKSGVKRKFVRNTCTQTSLNSSSDTSSLLDTPLPRKCHPVPITRDWKSDLSKKHVHFDTPDKTNMKNTTNITANPITSVESRSEATVRQFASTGRNSRLSLEHERQMTSGRSSNADVIVNDISKLRQELRDALRDTELTKRSLKNLDDRIYSQISSSDESVFAFHDHSKVYPIDAYLRANRSIPQELSNLKVEDQSEKETNPTRDGDSGLCSYALSVLRDVQRQKDNLERNLNELSRRHHAQYLYDVIENDTTFNGDFARIRRDVARKIEQMDEVLKAELEQEEEQIATRKEVSAETPKPAKQARSIRGVPISTENRAKLRSTSAGKVNSTKQIAAKSKNTKQLTKFTSMKQLSSGKLSDHNVQKPLVLGERVKRNSVRYQSPGKVERGTSRKSCAEERLDDSNSSTIQDSWRPPTQRCYFQSDVPAKKSVIEEPVKEHHKSVFGQTLPLAIPLGKPRVDSSLRPLLYNDEEAKAFHRTETTSNATQSNVAVITIKDEECLQDAQTSMKRHKKSMLKKKEKAALEKQILPNIDIDTSTLSEESTVSNVSETLQRKIMLLSDPPQRPSASDYDEFKDYEHVRTQEDDQETEKSIEFKNENAISLSGGFREDKTIYEGPVFPPQNISTEMPDSDGNIGDLRIQQENVEIKARELIEHELLARIMSEMTPPVHDPTSNMRTSQSSESIRSYDSELDIAATIGLRGIQLFVDAGIPVHSDFIRNLIQEVLHEKITGMLGFPKSDSLHEQQPMMQSEVVNISTKFKTEFEDYPNVDTCKSTPSLSSVSEDRCLSHIVTPNKTTSSDSTLSPTSRDSTVEDKNLRDFVVSTNERDDVVEERLLIQSDVKSPVVTPIASPSPPRSVISINTPEVSEKVERKEQTQLEVPEITVSIQDKVSDESLYEDEDDNNLKEQTYVEDNNDENQNTEDDVPPINYESDPKIILSKITNSPSSLITTTTYSSRSTMGTFATDDEISEGEQLQPYVHAGQYSEGEFVAPMVVPGNMTTLHEIPDDILDNVNMSNADPIKQAFHGLLKSDYASDKSTSSPDKSTSNEEQTSSEGQQKYVSRPFVHHTTDNEDRSEGEMAGGDVVLMLLSRIRQSVMPSNNLPVMDGQDTPSLGEVQVAQRSMQRTFIAKENDAKVSPGEFVAQNRAPVNFKHMPTQTLEDSYVSDSDENNNSEQNSSIGEVRNKTINSNIIMVTPKKVEVSSTKRKPFFGISHGQSLSDNPRENTNFSQLVEVRHDHNTSTPTDRRSESGKNESKDTLAGYDVGSHDIRVTHHVTGEINRDEHPEKISPEESHISEGVLTGCEDSIDQISYLSGGEV